MAQLINGWISRISDHIFGMVTYKLIKLCSNVVLGTCHVGGATVKYTTLQNAEYSSHTPKFFHKKEHDIFMISFLSRLDLPFSVKREIEIRIIRGRKCNSFPDFCVPVNDKHGHHKNGKTELHFIKMFGGVAALVCIPHFLPS